MINPPLLSSGEELKTNFYGSEASREGKHLSRYWIYHFGSTSILSCHSLHTSHWFIQVKIRVESPIHKCDISFSIQICMVKPSLELIYVFARKKVWLSNTIQLPYLLTTQYIFYKLQQFKQKQADLFSYWIWTGLNCFSWNNAEVGP